MSHVSLVLCINQFCPHAYVIILAENALVRYVTMSGTSYYIFLQAYFPHTKLKWPI